MVKVSSLEVSFQRDWVLSDTNPSSRSTNNMFCTLSGVELWKLNLQAKSSESYGLFTVEIYKA